MVDAAVADIVGPAVTADDPHGLVAEVIGKFADLLEGRAVAAFQSFCNRGFRLRLRFDGFRSLGVVPVAHGVIESVLEFRRSLVAGEDLFHFLLQQCAVGIHGHAHAESEFRVVFEQGVRPCRTASVFVLGIRNRREGSAVDRGAAGGVRDHHVLAEQLRHQFDVRSFAAAGARSGEFKQRLAEHCSLHGGDGVGAHHIVRQDVVEELLVFVLACGPFGFEGRPGESRSQLAAAVDGALIHADTASGAVFNINLDLELESCVASFGGNRLEGGRSIGQFRRLDQFGADCRVRTRHAADIALHAGCGIPLRNARSDTAFLEAGRTGRDLAVDGHCGNRDAVSLKFHRRFDDLLRKLGCVIRQQFDHRRGGDSVQGFRDLHLLTGVDGRVDQGEVHVDHVIAFFLEGLLGHFLHALFRLFERNDSGDLEVCHHHDGVGAFAAQTGLFGDQFFCIDVVEFDLLFEDRFLHVARQMLEDLLVAVMRVQQEGSALFDSLQQVIAADIAERGAGDKVRRGDQIRALDRLHTEAQMRHGHTERFLGVVGEVRLRIHILAIFSDDLDGVFVRSDRSVSAETPEHAVRGSFRLRDDLFLHLEGGMGHIIVDTDGESVESVLGEVLEHCENHGRRELLRRESVPAADDPDVHPVQSDNHIQIERLADGARLFGPVEHGNPFDRGRQSLPEGLDVERTIQADLDQSQFHSALFIQVFDRLIDGFAAGAHCDDHIGGVRRSDIVEQMVLTAGLRSDFIHVLLNDRRRCIVELVDRFAALEVDVRVLSADVGDRSIRAESAGAELFNVFRFHQFADLVIRDLVILVNFMRGAESVEELQERNAGLVGGEVGDERKVHLLLHGSRREKSETGIAAGHHVGMIAEDGERLSREGAGGHMEHGRDQFSGDLVHVRDHEKQTLGGGIGACQSSGDQRPVNGSGSSGFRLHFRDPDFLAPNVLSAFCRPLVHPFSHGGRRGDRVDGCDFAQCISDVCGTIITVLRVCDARHSKFPP